MQAAHAQSFCSIQQCFNPRFRLPWSAFLGLLLGSLLWSRPAAGVTVPTLDQSHVVDVAGGYRAYNIYSGYRYAQTFQVGVAGILAQVDLQVLRQALTVAEASQITLPLTLSIMTVAGNGSPGGLTLGTFSIAAASVPAIPITTPQLTSVDVLAAGIMTSPGQSLALVLTSALPPPPIPAQPTPAYGLITKPLNTYATGNGWSSPPGFGWTSLSSDFGFKSYVVPVPEPTALAIFTLAAIAGLGRRR